MATYTVELASVPNVDFADQTRRTHYIKPQRRVVANFAEASGVCREFIVENDLGGGNWAGGRVRNEHNKVIAYVSYNGRVWKWDGKDHLKYDGEITF